MLFKKMPGHKHPHPDLILHVSIVVPALLLTILFSIELVYYIYIRAINKCADQTVQMRRLVKASVSRMQQTDILARPPNYV